MVLDHDRLVNHIAYRWVKEQTRGFFGERVTITFLRPQIGVNLIDVSAAQCFFPIPASCHNGVELRVNDDTASRVGVVEDDVGSHRGEDLIYAQTLAFNLPVNCFARIDAPASFGKHDIIETGDPFLVKLPNPGNFSIWQRQLLCACGLCRQGEIKGQMGRSNHRLIICIVSSKAVDGNFATIRTFPGYAHAS